jgi:hypothetical protein
MNMKAKTNSSTILAATIVASTILLAASILPVAYAQTPRQGSFRDTETFTVEGDSLAELRQDARGEVNALPIPNAQKAAVLNDITAQ